MWEMWTASGEIFPDVEQQRGKFVVTAYYPESVDVAAVEAGYCRLA